MDWNESQSAVYRRINALLDKHHTPELSEKLVGLTSDQVRRMLANSYPEPPKPKVSNELIELMTEQEFAPYRKRLGQMAHGKWAHVYAKVLSILPATSIAITRAIQNDVPASAIPRIRERLLDNKIIKRDDRWPQIKTYHAIR
jgi:hypothetical protein